MNKAKAKEDHERLSWLKDECDFISRNDARLNRLMRDRLRPERKEEKERKAKRKALGLPEHIRLLPENPEDIALSKNVVFGRRLKSKSHRSARREIFKSSIFNKKSCKAAQKRIQS